jgi:thiamine biosynthesis lipoprotein
MKEFKREIRLMGSSFSFTVCAGSSEEANLYLNSCISEVQRIEKRLTEFSDLSDTARINKMAGIAPAEIEVETFQLISRCINISRLTRGAFDITAGALKKIYQFNNSTFQFPPEESIRRALATTGYRFIRMIVPDKVYLEKPGMHISFGAIGKGYAADCVKKKMMDAGVTGGVINASGDLCSWGNRADGSAWKAGIAMPGDPEKIILWFPLNDLALATSGDYEQYFEQSGKRYSHNIDPRNGRPVTGISSVSIAGPAAELCDALATAVTVMGVEEGLAFVQHLPKTFCIIVNDQQKIYHSKNVELSL